MTPRRCLPLVQLLLLLPLLVAATEATIAETAVEPSAYSVENAHELEQKQYEQLSDCNCLAERDALLYMTACGPVIGLLTLGQPLRILAGAPVDACGRHWTPLLIAGGLVAWTTTDAAAGGPACRSCRTRRQQRLPSASVIDATVVAGPSATLIRCLCVIESGCNRAIGCRLDVGSLSCGPFQIKLPYWSDASVFARKKLGGDWKTCTTGANNMACSVQTVMFYLARYAKRCVGSGREPNDEDYARVHNGGPQGCNKSSTLAYWNRVHTCMVKNS